MVHGFGKWQNSDCRGIKEALMDLDPDGSGRVALGRFYSKPATGKYRFSESTEYLQQIGALDETGWRPKVLIANYVAGPSNCIASSEYYSVCCLSDCEGLMNAVEAQIQAPTASPDQLLNLVSNLSSPSVDAPRQLQPGLVQKLHSIAARNGGAVPLHGRLFAQWLHHAFPNDCPYPSTPRSVQALSMMRPVMTTPQSNPFFHSGSTTSCYHCKKCHVKAEAASSLCCEWLPRWQCFFLRSISQLRGCALCCVLRGEEITTRAADCHFFCSYQEMHLKLRESLTVVKQA